MKGKNKPSPAAGEFLFEIDSEPLEECLTAWGGVPLLVRAARSLDLPGLVQGHVPVKQRERGFDEATYVGSFLVLNAVGGDCLEDFDQLREDGGLKEMLGHEVPSAEAARKFLYQFHEEKKIEQAQQELARGQVSYIPGENEALAGFGGATGADWIRGKRAPECGFAGGDSGYARRPMAALPGRQRDHQRVCRSRLRSRGKPGEPVSGTVALRGLADSAQARRVVRRRQRGEAFRGGDQSVGVDAEEVAAMASGK